MHSITMVVSGGVPSVQNDETRRLSRRAALTAAVAGIGSLAGCPLGGGPEDDAPTEPPTVSEQPDEQPQTEEPRFETVVNVADEGAATDASASITDLITAHADDDTALVFPDGRYRVEPVLLSDLENFGMFAAPNADPVLVPTGPADEVGKFFFQITSVKRFLFEGFSFDFTQEGFGGMTYILGTGDFTVRNLQVDGPIAADISTFRFDVVERDSQGLVENVAVTDGSEPESTSIGMYVGNDHAGTLVFRNCEVANFPNNGLYASSPGLQDELTGANGPVKVEGGSYRNNNIANVRLGSDGSYIKDAEVVIDEEPPPFEGDINARGIRFRNRGGHLVENCDVRIEASGVRSLGGIVVHPTCRNARVRDTSITVESESIPAINLLTPDQEGSSSSFENVEIRGSANGGNAVQVLERDGTTFQGCTVEQDGGDRNGLRFEGSQKCTLNDSEVSATAEPLVSIDSDVSTRDTRLHQLGSDGESDDGDARE